MLTASGERIADRMENAAVSRGRTERSINLAGNLAGNLADSPASLPERNLPSNSIMSRLDSTSKVRCREEARSDDLQKKIRLPAPSAERHTLACTALPWRSRPRASCMTPSRRKVRRLPTRWRRQNRPRTRIFAGSEGQMASAAEVDVLTSLEAWRRAAMDAREAQMQVESNLLAATETRVDAKIAQLKALQVPDRGPAGPARRRPGKTGDRLGQNLFGHEVQGCRPHL